MTAGSEDRAVFPAVEAVGGSRGYSAATQGRGAYVANRLGPQVGSGIVGQGTGRQRDRILPVPGNLQVFELWW